MSLATRFNSKKVSSELSKAKFIAADTLSGDQNSSTKPDGIEYRAVPQISDHSDTNPSPDNYGKQQDMGHGEPDLGVIQQVLGDEKKGDPEQGDNNPDRHELLKNFPADRTAQELGKNQSWWNRIVNGPIGFDGFLKMLGDGEYLTQAHLNAMNPQLLKLLQAAKAIGTEAIFKIDPARIKAVADEMRKDNLNLSTIDISTIEKYLKQTKPVVQDINRPEFTKTDDKKHPKPGHDGEFGEYESRMIDVLGALGQEALGLPILKMIPPEVQQAASADIRAHLIFDLIHKYKRDMTIEEFANLDLTTLIRWWEEDNTKKAMRRRKAQLTNEQIQQKFAEIAERFKVSNTFEQTDAQWLNHYNLRDDFLRYFSQSGMDQNTPAGQAVPQPEIEKVKTEEDFKKNFPFDERQLTLFKDNVMAYLYKSYVQKNNRKARRNNMARLSVAEVRAMSPRFAAKMEKMGIEWVEEEPFMKALGEFNQAQIEMAENPCKFVFYHRRNGVSINALKRTIAAKLENKEITADNHDLACVFMDRMAESDMAGQLETYASLKEQINKWADTEATRALKSVSVFVKEAAKKVLAKDYTLYHMEMGTSLDRFNYNDSWDIEWTLYKQTKEGKKGSKVDVYPSPGRCLYRIVENGDGEYLCVGQTKLDDSYWGTYTIKIVNGIVVQYAKVPVDKEGKRFANVDKQQDLQLSRMKYIAMYKAVKKHCAQSGIQQPAFTDFPSDDDEWAKRIQQFEEYFKNKGKETQTVNQKLKGLTPKNDVPLPPPPIPSQEDMDKRIDEEMQKFMAEHPEAMK